MSERIWKPSSERTIDRTKTVYIDVREITTYRWKPYKPDGQRQMKAQGRWQKATGIGDYTTWTNCAVPDGEWAPNEPKELP